MCHMSKMAEMAAEIEDMYFDDNLDIWEIAKLTGLPAEDIRGFIDEMKEQDEYDEPWDGFNSDAEADADALASAGFGTDEDYGCSAEDML